MAKRGRARARRRRGLGCQGLRPAGRAVRPAWKEAREEGRGARTSAAWGLHREKERQIKRAHCEREGAGGQRPKQSLGAIGVLLREGDPGRGPGLLRSPLLAWAARPPPAAPSCHRAPDPIPGASVESPGGSTTRPAGRKRKSRGQAGEGRLSAPLLLRSPGVARMGLQVAV